MNDWENSQARFLGCCAYYSSLHITHLGRVWLEKNWNIAATCILYALSPSNCSAYYWCRCSGCSSSEETNWNTHISISTRRLSSKGRSNQWRTGGKATWGDTAEKWEASLREWKAQMVLAARQYVLPSFLPSFLFSSVFLAILFISLWFLNLKLSQCFFIIF